MLWSQAKTEILYDCAPEMTLTGDHRTSSIGCNEQWCPWSILQWRKTRLIEITHLPAPKIPVMVACCVSYVIWNTHCHLLSHSMNFQKLDLSQTTWSCEELSDSQVCIKFPHSPIILRRAKIQRRQSWQSHRNTYGYIAKEPVWILHLFAFWQLYSEVGCSPGASISQ